MLICFHTAVPHAHKLHRMHIHIEMPVTKWVLLSMVPQLVPVSGQAGGYPVHLWSIFLLYASLGFLYLHRISLHSSNDSRAIMNNFHINLNCIINSSGLPSVHGCIATPCGQTACIHIQIRNICFTCFDLLHLVCTTLLQYMAELPKHSSGIYLASMSFGCHACSHKWPALQNQQFDVVRQLLFIIQKKTFPFFQ